MDIELEKLELIKLIEETENPEIIKDIKCVFELDKMGILDKLTEEQIELVYKNVKLDENGNFLNFDEIIASFKII